MMFSRFSAFRRNAQQTQRGFGGRPGASRFPAAGLGAAQQAKSLRYSASPACKLELRYKDVGF